MRKTVIKSPKHNARLPSADTQCAAKKHTQISKREYLEYLYAAHIVELTGLNGLLCSRKCRQRLALQMIGIKNALERLNNKTP